MSSRPPVLSRSTEPSVRAIGLWCSHAALDLVCEDNVCFKRARSYECRQKSTCRVRAQQVGEREYATQSVKPRLSLRETSQKTIE